MKKICLLILTSLSILLSDAQPGTLDSSFGNNGKVATDFGSDESIASSVLQTDGKIVVGGKIDIIPNKNYRLEVYALARYKTDGGVDSSFGVNGISYNRIGRSFSGIKSIAIQNDGKIIAAGYANLYGYFNQLTVLRYAKNGRPDSSFGLNGIAFIRITGSSVSANAVIVQPDGKIIVAGTVESRQNKSIIVARFRHNGQLDSSFGFNGKRITPVGINSGAQAVALSTNGKITVAGFGTPANAAFTQFALVRYTSGGDLDAGFGDDGKVITSFDGVSQANSVALSANGKIVVAGYTQVGTYFDFALVRYTMNGSVDSTFGTNGKTITDFGYSDEGNAVAVQSNGKIVVAGSSYDAQNSFNTYFAVARYKSNGKPDMGFGTNGKLLTGFSGTQSVAGSVLIQPDGKILAAGYATQKGMNNQDFALARYIGDLNGLPGKQKTEITANSAITISPNPVKDFLTIKGIRSPGKTKLIITDFAGNIIMQSIADINFKMDVQQLHRGPYYLIVKNSAQYLALLFLKE